MLHTNTAAPLDPAGRQPAQHFHLGAGHYALGQIAAEAEDFEGQWHGDILLHEDVGFDWTGVVMGAWHPVTFGGVSYTDGYHAARVGGRHPCALSAGQRTPWHDAQHRAAPGEILRDAGRFLDEWPIELGFVPGSASRARRTQAHPAASNGSRLARCCSWHGAMRTNPRPFTRMPVLIIKRLRLRSG